LQQHGQQQMFFSRFELGANPPEQWPPMSMVFNDCHLVGFYTLSWHRNNNNRLLPFSVSMKELSPSLHPN
jgi:hypothetical protein